MLPFHVKFHEHAQEDVAVVELDNWLR